MVSRMRTTVEIADSILHAAKETAHREGTTLQSLVEEGLRLALERRERMDRFRLRDSSVGGRGLRAELGSAGWKEIRDIVYEGRES